MSRNDWGCGREPKESFAIRMDKASSHPCPTFFLAESVKDRGQLRSQQRKKAVLVKGMEDQQWVAGDFDSQIFL